MSASIGDFELLQRIVPSDATADVVVTKWRSRKTGLSVVHIDNDGMLIFDFLLSLSLTSSASFIRANIVLRTEGE